MSAGPTVPPATVARLPIYLRALDELVSRGAARTSSGELAALAGVGPAQLRRDLSCLGSHGVRGVGYDVAHLRSQGFRVVANMRIGGLREAVFDSSQLHGMRMCLVEYDAPSMIEAMTTFDPPLP